MEIMKKISLLLFSLLSLLSHQFSFTENAGFTGNTIIHLAQEKTNVRLYNDGGRYRVGPQTYLQITKHFIKDIQVNNEAQCWTFTPTFYVGDEPRNYIRQLDHKKILNIVSHETTHYYTIVIARNEYYTCGEDQKFYDSNTDNFLKASEIHKIVSNGGLVKLATWYNPSQKYPTDFNGQGVENGFSHGDSSVFASYEFDTPNDPITLYDITVDDCHSYRIGTYGIIAHNMEAVARFAFDNAGAVFEGIGVAIGGWAANWQRNRQEDVHRAHFENGHIVYAVPPADQPTPPNNSNNQGGPGDPKKPGESDSSKKNGPSHEDIQLLITATERRRKNLEDPVLYQKNQPTIKKADLPEKAKEMFDKYSTHKWQGNVPGQTPGTNAGGRFNNEYGELPVLDANNKPISYNKFDINNRIEGAERDAERFIRGTDGSIYYTKDHYSTLIKVE